MFSSRKTPLRRLALWTLALYAVFTLVPAVVYGFYQWGKAEPESSSLEESPPGFLEGTPLEEASPLPEEGGERFAVYDTATGETYSLTPEEFLPWALACEMDLSAPDEALKAQAVALYTFYTYQKEQNTGEEADFACDSSQWLVYAPPQAFQERWGEGFQGYAARLQELTDAVAGQCLTWEGQPICAAFFAISGGATASASHVWGQEVPYLQAVASPGDAFAQGYLSTVHFTAEELQAAAAAAWGEDLDFSGPAETWVTEISASPSEYVASAQVGGKTVTGEELRETFGLRSACFQLQVEDGVFQFAVHGWGHGVGMSQAGAAFLANQGFSYQEILAHYYPGTTLEGVA